MNTIAKSISDWPVFQARLRELPEWQTTASKISVKALENFYNSFWKDIDDVQKM